MYAATNGLLVADVELLRTLAAPLISHNRLKNS